MYIIFLHSATSVVSTEQFFTPLQLRKLLSAYVGVCAQLCVLCDLKLYVTCEFSTGKQKSRQKCQALASTPLGILTWDSFRPYFCHVIKVETFHITFETLKLLMAFPEGQLSLDTTTCAHVHTFSSRYERLDERKFINELKFLQTVDSHLY